MSRRALSPLLAVLIAVPAPVFAAEFAVVQSAAPTVNSTNQDFTSSGFGTPKCSLHWASYGTANGTSVSHAGFGIGAYDGTREFSMFAASENGVAPMDTGSLVDTNAALATLATADQTQNGETTASFITDGVRFAWADAPPSAYLINTLLVGGSGVSDCYVGQATGNATQDATTVVSAPGFQPDIIIAWANNAVSTHMRPSYGMAWRNGGSIVQRALGFNDTDANATSSVQSILATDRVMVNAVAGQAQLEVTSFDASGFTITTRDAAAARTITYMAIKLSGLSAFLHTSAAPTATGDQAITGVGFRPQVGLMLQGEFAAVDTLYSASDGEVFGFSVFTEGQSASSAVWANDGAGTSGTDSLTDTKVCATRKDSAAYATCTLSSFDSDGATYNYTATNGTARQRAVLYVQTSAASSNMMLRRRNQ